MQSQIVLTMAISMLMSVSLTSAQDIKSSDAPKPTLKSAIEEFNRSAANDEVGKNEPPLTEDEVIAAILLCDRKATPVKDAMYREFKAIADSRQMPKGATLNWLNGTTTTDGRSAVVWWVDLMVMKSDNTGYGFRIRDRKIRMRLPRESAQDFIVMPPKK